MKTKFLRTSSSLTLKVCIVINVSKVKGLVEGFVNASTFGCFFFCLSLEYHVYVSGKGVRIV